MEGLVVKLVAGVYSVETVEGVLLDCKAKGTFRNDGIRPLVGDRVEIDEQDCVITEVLPRKNSFIRPAVANVDQLCIVISPLDPKADLVMVDKLIATATANGVEVILCINKCDSFEEEADLIRMQYAQTDVTVLKVSAREGKGLDALRDRLVDRFTCFTGQSAVGKSSVLNALFPELQLQTGGLSRKTARGRHTTRHLEIFRFGQVLVADTPGFSLLECPDLEPEEFALLDGQMYRLSEGCKFNGCQHNHEPGCAVKAEVGKAVCQERYDRYILILEELIEKRKKQYD